MTAQKHLSAQQRAFAEAVASGKSVTAAADAAGYRHADKYGTRLVKIPHVAAEIERLRAKVRKASERKSIADAIEIQEFHTKVLRGELQDVDTTLSGDTVERPVRVRERRASADSLAKMLGAMNGDNGATVNVNMGGVSREQAIADLVKAIETDPDLASAVRAALKRAR